MQYYAVLGNPIAHSLSPTIHQAFAKSVGITLSYEKIEVPIGKFAETIQKFRDAGGNGANVTLPFKQEAFNLCNKVSPAAQIAKAVNTIGWEGESLWGENTDGEGLLNDLVRNKNIQLAQKRVLILGAGGAAQGILAPLLAEQPESIMIVNRDITKAERLAEQDSRIIAFDYASMPTQHEPIDIVINATSASLQNTVPSLQPHWVEHTIAIDLAYLKQGDTIFMQWAKEQGAKEVFDGMGMLVEQAAISFRKWHGMLPDTKHVIDLLRSR